MTHSFDDANRLTRDLMDAGLESLAALAKSVHTAAIETIDYSVTSIERGATALEEVFSAGSLEKAMQAQSDYSRQTYGSFVAQATRMNELYADTAKEACRPFESSFRSTK